MNKNDRQELVELYVEWGKFRFHIQKIIDQIVNVKNVEQYEAGLYYANLKSEVIQKRLAKQLIQNEIKLKKDFEIN